MADDEKQHGPRPKFTGRSGEPHAEFVPVVLRLDPIFVEYDKDGNLVVMDLVSRRELDAANAFFRERTAFSSNQPKSTARNDELVKADPKTIELVTSTKKIDPPSGGTS